MMIIDLFVRIKVDEKEILNQKNFPLIVKINLKLNLII